MASVGGEMILDTTGRQEFVMARGIRTHLPLTLLFGVVLAGTATAEPPAASSSTTATANPPSTSATTDEAAFINSLPHPPDLPASLLTEPAPMPPRPGMPERYFEADPLTDPPEYPPPGWFITADVDILKPHLKNHLNAPVELVPGSPDNVKLDAARLGWTASPILELGYHLPSGFGAFAFSYRFLGSDGTNGTIGPDGTASLKSRLNMSVIDADYKSWEMSLWPHWDMSWRAGLRYANIYFDSTLNQPFDQAAAGSGILSQHNSNSYWGIGPHAGWEVARRFDPYNLAFLIRLDGAMLIGRIKQDYSETGVDGTNAQTHLSSSQAVPMLNGQVGARWQPRPGLSVFAGYLYEYWWNVGRLSAQGQTLTPPRGELADQGIFLRAEWNF
jgi:Legionella pneumophila major outer membrane protein precursor